ncbi:hypothetical protein [Streptomyces rochei]|uniref:hypothetical protein n=1 Tax=Streptomyces rochei TaxID=1928 RepID=UPI003644764F
MIWVRDALTALLLVGVVWNLTGVIRQGRRADRAYARLDAALNALACTCPYGTRCPNCRD